MRMVFIILFFLQSFYSVKAQISINVSGLDITSNYGTINYSIGGIFFQNKGMNYHVNEGVQQCFIINPIYTHSKLRLSIYPNPTIDLIYFKVENFNYVDLHYILYDAIGNALLKGKILDTKSFISLKNLPSQPYFLKCYRGISEENSFKIIKSY